MVRSQKNQGYNNTFELEEDIDFNFSDKSIESQDDVEKKIIKFLDYKNLKKITKAVNLILPLQDKINFLIYRINYLIQCFQNGDIVNPIVEAVNKEFIWCLLVIVKSSAKVLRDFAGIEKAASTAITILNAARVSFSGIDFSGVRIPGADLSDTVCDSTDFTGADKWSVF